MIKFFFISIFLKASLEVLKFLFLDFAQSINSTSHHELVHSL